MTDYLPDGAELVLDFSQNDVGKTDPDCLVSQGVTKFYGSPYSNDGNAPHTMANFFDYCLGRGMKMIGLYGLVYFGDKFGETRDTRWNLELAGDYHVERVAMDCEIDALDAGWTSAPRPAPAQRVQALVDVRHLIEEHARTPEIYAGEYWWRDKMAGSDRFADLDWWLSRYGWDSFPAPPTKTADFGFGLVKLRGHQFTSRWGEVAPYTANDPRCGRANRDANYFWLGGAPVSITEERIALIESRQDKLANVLAGWGFTAIEYNDDGSEKGRRVLTHWEAIDWLDTHQDSFAEGVRLMQDIIAVDEQDDAKRQAAIDELVAHLNRETGVEAARRTDV